MSSSSWLGGGLFFYYLNHQSCMSRNEDSSEEEEKGVGKSMNRAVVKLLSDTLTTSTNIHLSPHSEFRPGHWKRLADA